MAKINTQKVNIPIPESSLPFNFDYNLSYYLFHPWIREGDTLVRLFKANEKHLLLRIHYQEKPEPKMVVNVLCKVAIDKKDISWVEESISWMFSIHEEVKVFYDQICPKDPVLSAASKQIYGAHLRRDLTVFEAVIGVIVAQNVYFKRVYKMMELLCTHFGEKETFDRKTYSTFPSPQALAKAKLEEIRGCSVGYRDKYIKGVAEKIVHEKLDLNSLRDLDDADQIRKKLIELPGVGPYTADLAMAIGFAVPSFHLDLFTREVLYTFYFNGEKVSDDKLIAFVDEKWGKWKHYAMLLLTTNTDEWAKDLGVNFRLKSAARYS